ncbi:hypothetical protein [Ornithinimicrobium flavum]|uniref:hypothetical protein n=1 Tax=Ornithinimicrobium flavum TaxID=1288636 RepID=UPI0010701748|nr:hypothetical protein [Ornithinimicrobium flavum]
MLVPAGAARGGGTTVGHGRDGARSAGDRDPQSSVVLVLVVLVGAFLLWRVRHGVDQGDGAHVVALAVRLAEGATPFVDEMNVQSLGSLAAVPFTWVWLQLVGLEGVVLASRTWYLLLALGAGVVGYRALRTGLRPLPAFTGVALACVPTPYNLLVTSYNTVPGLALGVATFAGYAALTRSSGRWAAVSGAALAVSVLAHPSSLPAAAVLGLVVLVLGLHRTGVVRGLLLGGGSLSAVVILWVVAGPGIGALLETLSYTTDYQASRPHPVDRLADTTRRFAEVVVSPAFVPALVLALLAGLPRVPARLRTPSMVLVAPAAAVPAALSLSDPTRLVTGATSGTYAVLVVLALVVPVALWSARTPHRDLRLLLALSGPPAVVGLVTYALATSAKGSWGVIVPPALPLYGVLGIGAVLAATQAWGRRDDARDDDRGRSTRRPLRPVPLAAVALLVVPLLGVHTLHSFRDPAPWRTTARITEGPNAGLSTTPEGWVQDCRTRRAVSGWVGPGETLLAYAEPSVYLYTEARAATNIVWLGTFGAVNQATVDWLDERGAWPDVVLVLPSVASDWTRYAADDPLLQRLGEDYGTYVGAGPFGVQRRDGAVSPPYGPVDLAACDLP